jgi:hypothetical protein
MSEQDLKEFVIAHRLVKKREQDLKEAKKLKEDIEKLVLEYMNQEGITYIRVEIDGKESGIKLHSQFWAKAKVDKQDAVAGLRQAGLGRFVSEGFNTNTISSYIRELKKKGKPIPEELESIFTFVDEHHARVSK